MPKILIAGRLSDDDSDLTLREARKHFTEALGQECVNRGHVVLGGCRSDLDAAVASAAGVAAARLNVSPMKVVRSWVTRSTKPSHSVGEVVRSRVEDWGQVPRGFAYPEPVQEADVVLIVGGGEGTHYAASWARLANKPLVPVATFGLAAAEIYEAELTHYEYRYGQRLPPEDFQMLNRVLPDLQSGTVEVYAKEVIALAERMITPTQVFVIMSFAETGPLIDAYDTFRRVCTAKGFTAFKVNEHIDSNQRIVPEIMSSIRHSAFIIADLSEPRPNVYYELGYAQAAGKEVIVTAAKGTDLPFDIFDIPTLYWDSQNMLERKLEERIARVLTKSGRRF